MNAFLNGGNIHYVDDGAADGLPVLFVHGFPFSHEMWTPQLEALQAAKGRGYRTIAYDVRGHGLSDVGEGQYTIEGHVDDLFALMDHLRVPKAVVVGLSMGGYITLRAIERNPERFLGLVLCDTKSDPDTDENRLRRFAGMTIVKRSGSHEYADTFVRGVFAKSSLTQRTGDVDKIRSIIAHTPPLSIAGTLLALAARTSTTPSLSRISVPTLILVGEHDETTPPDSARAMHQQISLSELHVIPNAAHMSTMENPETVNPILLSFLERHFPGAPAR